MDGGTTQSSRNHTTHGGNSYATSEMFEVPGVLSVFVCGIIFSHFAWHSLAPGG